MIFSVSQRPGTGVYALTLFEGSRLADDPLWKRISPVGRALLTTLVRRKRITGKLYDVQHIDCSGTRPEAVYILGLGKKGSYHHRRMLRAFGTLIKTAHDHGVRELSIAPDLMLQKAWTTEANMEALSVTAMMANYVFAKHKKEPSSSRQTVARVTFVVDDDRAPAVRRGTAYGKIVGDAVNAARDLANTPGGIMTPTLLVRDATEMLKGLPVNVSVFGEKEMRQLGMGGILGVSSGSSEEAKFLVMEYLPLKGAQPLVFIGKGVTFDSGGLNLKPEQAITDMHHDMAGAGAVVAALAASARLKVQRNIVGITPLVENMPGGSGYRPGDLLKTMSGITVEVGNTDAEGRVVLADALTYAKRYKPAMVIDVATLTGAAMVALGKRLIAGFSSNETLALALRQFSEQSGDYVWPLPLWEEFSEDIRGTFGDINNSGRTRGAGGAITAAAFLKEFVGSYTWAHLDIAPTMVAYEGQPLAPGATGTGVRLLVDIARRFDELSSSYKTT